MRPSGCRLATGVAQSSCPRQALKSTEAQHSRDAAAVQELGLFFGSFEPAGKPVNRLASLWALPTWQNAPSFLGAQAPPVPNSPQQVVLVGQVKSIT